MKKYILSLILFTLFISTSKAETITLSGPWSPTGSFQKIIRLIVSDMENKGWKFDVKITGNPLLSKTNAESSSTPYILTWGIEINSKKSDTFYLAPPSKSNYVGMTHISNQFLCGKKGLTLSDLKNKNKIYKIGVGVDPMLVNWLTDFVNYLGVKHTIIKYKGSTKSSNALLSGELDFVLNSNGAKMHKKGQADCLLVPSSDSVIGIPTVKSKFPKFSQPVMYNAMYWQVYNMDSASLKKLREDFSEALKNKELRKMLSDRYAGEIKISLDDQLKIISFYDSRLTN